ncbi:hypothetical protein D3C87_699670 [compost metagenome]
MDVAAQSFYCPCLYEDKREARLYRYALQMPVSQVLVTKHDDYGFTVLYITYLLLSSFVTIAVNLILKCRF